MVLAPSFFLLSSRVSDMALPRGDIGCILRSRIFSYPFLPRS
jgi:hypothetical protein